MVINIISNIMMIISSKTIINITTMVIIGTWRSSKLWWRLAQTYRCQIILVALASSTGGDCEDCVMAMICGDDFGGTYLINSRYTNVIKLCHFFFLGSVQSPYLVEYLIK